VFQPSPDQPLDFEATIEATLLDLHRRFNVRKVLFDPYQMAATAQRLTRAGMRIEEFPQTSGNLTIASQNLYELIQGRNLAVYPDAALRLAISRAVAVETSRGWRITKEKASHKIDVVVALGMAAHAAVTSENSEVRVTWSLATDAGTWSSADGGTFVSSLGPRDQYGGHAPSERWETERRRIVRDGNSFYEGG
jgi:phage terminase large subunit-like protein